MFETWVMQVSDFFMNHKVIAAVVNFLMKHADFIFGIVINLILIGVFCKLADAFNAKLEKKLLEKHPDSPLINLMPIITRIAKVVIIFLLLAGFLQSFGYNVNSLIAGFGITGLAVGFAAKEAIGNVFGSFGLLADRVYKVGDYICFDSYEGTVTDINLRSTTITTIQGFEVNIPNNLLANNEITNVSKATERRIDLTVDIEYGTSNEKIDRAYEILKEIADQNNLIKKGANSFIENMAPSSIQVRLIAYTTDGTLATAIAAKSQIIRSIIHHYRAEGIEFAFPSMSLYGGDANFKVK
jgi:MscS family membrane protein